jgi:hypothetical protein
MEQLLAKLKNIEPEKEFKERSRALILNSPQSNFYPMIFNRFLHTAQFSAAFGMAAILIFLIIGGLSILNKNILSPALLSSLNPENLNQEAENLDIQIQLSQLEYYENSAEKIEIALKETSGDLKESKDRDSQLNKLLNELAL